MRYTLHYTYAMHTHTHIHDTVAAAAATSCWCGCGVVVNGFAMNLVVENSHTSTLTSHTNSHIQKGKQTSDEHH